jgi:hypothetical protein
MIIIEFILLAAMLAISYRVMKLTKLKNLRISLLILFMNLSSITYIVYLFSNMADNKRRLEAKESNKLNFNYSTL